MIAVKTNREKNIVEKIKNMVNIKAPCLYRGSGYYLLSFLSKVNLISTHKAT